MSESLAASRESTLVRVLVDSGADAGAELTLEQPGKRYALGRASGNDVVLRETNASRRHVEVFARNGQVYARDLGSKNGTLLAGLPLPSKEETAWPHDAVMQIGSDRFRLMDPVTEALLELEQAADEVIPTDEEVPIPNPVVATDANPDPTSEVQVVTRRPAAKTPAADRPGASGADWFVGLVAVLVLIISLFGLYWLLGSH